VTPTDTVDTTKNPSITLMKLSLHTFLQLENWMCHNLAYDTIGVWVAAGSGSLVFNFQFLWCGSPPC